MSFLYLEARKGILRRYTLIALALFLCLNTVKIIADYHAGEIRPVAANTSGMQSAPSGNRSAGIRTERSTGRI